MRKFSGSLKAFLFAVLRRKAPTWIAALALLFAVPLFAAPVSPELAAKIDQLFARWNHPNTPGVIVAIARTGETIYSRGYGMANLEHGIPLTPATITESGSVAKQFTAAAVVLLAQRGQLSLEDPVRKYLPELSADLACKITVRMLLNHTSGLRDIHGLNDLLGRPSYTAMHDNAEVLRIMSRQKQLNFEPGSEYLYCNAAYVLASIIVQRASGQSFGTFCEEHIFRPRGMSHTHWREDFSALILGRATGYKLLGSANYGVDAPYSNIIGNGGLLFTVEDLLKWNAGLDETSGEWGMVARTLQTPSRLNNGRTIDYGLGLVIDDFAGLREVSHGGSTSGYKTFLARIPERQLSFALLGNAAEFNPTPVAQELVRLVLDLPTAANPAGISIPDAATKTFAGLYHCVLTDDLMTLTVTDGKLRLRSTVLVPTAPGTFVSASEGTTFVFTESSPRRLTVTTRNGTADYSAVTAAHPSTTTLAEYAGVYRSEELEVADTVSVNGGHLVVERWPRVPVEAKPTMADGFWFGPEWHATFTRDSNGAVNGYELTNGRCRRVRFTRL